MFHHPDRAVFSHELIRGVCAPPVSMDEISQHRRSLLSESALSNDNEENKESMIVKLLGCMCKEGGVTFPSMLARAYPTASKQDIAKCLKTMKNRKVRAPESCEMPSNRAPLDLLPCLGATDAAACSL